VLAQAASLALLAALSPAVLLTSAVYLGSPQPRRTLSAYFAGALVMSVVLAVAVLLALRIAGLNGPRQHSPRDGLRLAIGVLLLAAGVVIAIRRRRPRPRTDKANKRPGLVSRLTASPSARSAFAVGVLLFAPGLTFIGALQVIATSHADIELTLLAVVVVVIIDAALIWLPLVLHLAAPGPTERYLKAFNGWLRAHSGALLTGVLIVAGVVLVVSGSYGLASGT
jgi:Sap, sulfolipid-1-addressing protein